MVIVRFAWNGQSHSSEAQMSTSSLNVGVLIHLSGESWPVADVQTPSAFT